MKANLLADQFVLQFQTGAGRAQQVFGRLAIEVARMEHGDFQSYGGAEERLVEEHEVGGFVLFYPLLAAQLQLRQIQLLSRYFGRLGFEGDA